MRVLITDALSPVALELLQEAGFEAHVHLGKTEEELRTLVGGHQGWLLRSGTRITAELLEAAPELQVIGRAGVGVDNVDLEAATRRGILVLNAPEGNTVSTAEHTCAMILALARQIPQADASLKRGEWARARFSGAELDGKALGVVGVGKVGRAVAARMQAFGMRLLGHDPVLAPEVAERLGIEMVGLERLLAESDVITLHTPLTEATRHLIDREALARCRRGVRLVNCARGGLIDEAALLEALEAGHVAGAALDVFAQEPPPAERAALVRHPRVVATPHIAASTGEAQEKVAVQVAEQLIEALRGRPVATPVNAGALRAAAQPEARPYLELAERLGRLAAQLSRGRVRRVVVGCSGETARHYAEVLTVAVLRGLLAQWLEGPVNLINAPVLAREHGLHVEEQRHSEPADFTNLLEVRLETEAGPLTLRGTVLGKHDPRLVEVDGFRIETRLEGRLLFYRNEDRPGMVATVGGVLAEAGVNIGSLALGRTGPGRVALTVMAVDEPIPASVLRQIEAVAGVEGVRVVQV